MGGNRTAPSRIINTPGGPRERTRMAGESMERDQRRRRSAFAPRKQRPMFTDRGERVQDKDMEARRSRRMERREERKQTFGDNFREQRKERRERRRERRREARDFFGRLRKRRTAEERGGRQSGMIRQVSKIDRDTGRRYGGKEIFNPETGDYEKLYNEPNIAKQDI